MATVTRRIGLSLGADICWPICYEDLMHELDLAIPIGGDTIRFDVRRVMIDPFDLRQPSRYDLVIDRLTHWYSTSREWIKKAILMDGLYVFNNPWSVQSMTKQTTYCAMMHLGLPIPDTWLIPPKEYEHTPDLQPTLERYAKMFDLGEIGAKLGYPLFMKPYDGGGWVAVTKVDDETELRDAYDKSGKFVMHLQKGIMPYEQFVRCIGLGPQMHIVRYDPSQPLHDRYQTDVDFLSAEDKRTLEDITLTINAFFGWDFNSCEALLQGETWYPIDFANPCPDSQVTSLHFHFPWLIKANLRWSIFCAATQRQMHANLDWKPFYEAAAREQPYRERLSSYAEIARAYFETQRFEAFCEEHLPHLDELTWDYFGRERAREAVGKKVRALYPEHEWEEFTERFWQRIQSWREYDATQRSAAQGKRVKI